MPEKPKWSERRAARKRHAVAAILSPADTWRDDDNIQTRVSRNLNRIAEATHSFVNQKGYAKKILKMTRAPVCNFLKVPITFVDAVREIVRFLCPHLYACSSHTQTHLAGGTCAEGSDFVRTVLEDMTMNLAGALMWLTNKNFSKDLAILLAGLKSGTAELKPEECKPLEKLSYKQRMQEIAKTIMTIPEDKRQSYIVGLKMLGEGVINYAFDKKHTTNAFEEVCLKNTLDYIKMLTRLAPDSWLSKDLIHVLSKTLLTLLKRPKVV